MLSSGTVELFGGVIRAKSWARWAVVCTVLVGLTIGCKTAPDVHFPTDEMTRTEHTETEFPIIAGFPHYSTECNGCHGGLPTFKDFTCMSCHEHSQEVLDPIHVGLEGYFEAASCYGCHPQGKSTDYGLSRDQHSPSPFPILEGAHAEVGCLECHTDIYTSPYSLECSSCHQEETPGLVGAHNGIPEFDLDNSTSCYECHPGGTTDVDRDLLDHISFPIGTDTNHGVVACSDCHPDPTDRRVLGCAACHLNETADLVGKHFGIETFDLDNSTTCYECHPGGTPDVTLDRQLHGAFPIAAVGNHQDVECAECHTDPNNRRVLACASCHADITTNLADRHEYVQDFVGTNSTVCYNCHPGGATEIKRIEHGAFPLIDPSSHTTTGCMQCHLDVEDRPLIACAQCHANVTNGLAAAHNGIGGFDINDSTTCYECHPGGTTNVALDREAHGAFPIAAPANHQDVQCSECHTDSADRSQLACSTCHQAITPTLVNAHDGIGGFDLNDSQTCYGCHSGGTVDGALDRETHDPIFPISTTAAANHATTTCAECHLDPADRSLVACSQCHQDQDPNLDTKHDLVKGFVLADNTGCKLCHSTGVVPIDVANDHIPQKFRIEGKHNRTCVECHFDLRPISYAAIDFTTGDCYGLCHKHTPTKMADKHNNVNGYVYEFHACATCHPDG